MWFLLILVTLVNALANNKTFVLEYRFTAAGVPINVFDVLLGLGLVLALLARPDRPGHFQVDRGHPLLVWMLTAAGLALAGGAAMGFLLEADTRVLLTWTRNFATLPVCVWIAYRVVNNPLTVDRFARLQILAGVGTTLMILVFFSERGAEYGTRGVGHINELRAVMYISPYAGIAAALLFYCIVAGVRIMPHWLTVALGVACFLGQFATLSRSDWVAATAAMLAAVFLLPRGSTGVGKLLLPLLLLPLLAGGVLLGTLAAERLTGRDFSQKMVAKVESLFPAEGSVQAEAYSARLPAAMREAGIWLSSPLWGSGFGVQESAQNIAEPCAAGYHHNTWSDTLAQTGLLGLAARGLCVAGLIVIGRRMVRDRVDRASVLMGALGAVTGVFFLMHGLTTMSFNQMRWAIPLGFAFGVLLRSRAMQLTQIRQMQQQWAAEAPPEQWAAGDPRGPSYGYPSDYSPAY